PHEPEHRNYGVLAPRSGRVLRHDQCRLCDLTIQSSRRRFAARPDSGVRQPVAITQLWDEEGEWLRLHGGPVNRPEPKALYYPGKEDPQVGQAVQPDAPAPSGCPA